MSPAQRASAIARRGEVQGAATRLVEAIREHAAPDDRPEAYVWAQAVLARAAREDFKVTP